MNIRFHNATKSRQISVHRSMQIQHFALGHAKSDHKCNIALRTRCSIEKAVEICSRTTLYFPFRSCCLPTFAHPCICIHSQVQSFHHAIVTYAKRCRNECFLSIKMKFPYLQHPHLCSVPASLRYGVSLRLSRLAWDLSFACLAGREPGLASGR